MYNYRHTRCIQLWAYTLYTIMGIHALYTCGHRRSVDAHIKVACMDVAISSPSSRPMGIFILLPMMHVILYYGRLFYPETIILLKIILTTTKDNYRSLLAKIIILRIFMCSHCSHIVVTLSSHCRHIVVTLSSYCFNWALRFQDFSCAAIYLSLWSSGGRIMVQRWPNYSPALAELWSSGSRIMVQRWQNYGPPVAELEFDAILSWLIIINASAMY